MLAPPLLDPPLLPKGPASPPAHLLDKKEGETGLAGRYMRGRKARAGGNPSQSLETAPIRTTPGCFSITARLTASSAPTASYMIDDRDLGRFAVRPGPA
jgi:hypothetical protein